MENKFCRVCRCECCNCCKCGKCCNRCGCVMKNGCCKKNYNNDCEEEQSKCEIMASIAIQEAGLAHILNAEGEKIQKSVQIARNVCELLEVNRSVINTIDSVTRLELTLLSKLNALKN